MRFEERTNLPHRQRDPFLRLLPREHADFGFGRQHRAFHGRRVGMGRNIVGQDKNRRLALAHEIARHGEDEVGVGAEHLGDELVDLLHGQVGPALDQIGSPAGHAAVVEHGRLFRPEADRLRRHRGDNAVRRPLDQVPLVWI